MEEEIGKVTEEVTENTDAQTVEEFEEGIELTDTADTGKENDTKPVEEKEQKQPKGRFMTDEEIDNLVMKKVNRRMAKLEAQKERELSVYKDTENVLKVGLKANDIQDANQKLRDYYEQEGIKLPDVYKPGLSQREMEILAKAEAEDIIEDGYNTMMSEASKLASKEYKNLNDRERIILDTLFEEINKEKDKRELLSLGAKEDVLKDDNFIKFRKQFNSKTPIKDVYSLYLKTQPKPKVENPGSMKNKPTPNDVKDYYTPEEASKFTKKDYDKNPKLLEAVERSMTKWV